MIQKKAALITFAFSQILAAQEGPIGELDLLLGDITTISADILQLIIESDGGVLEETEIKMLLKRPDKLYWETVTPFQELILTNGEILWNYQPDLEQVTIENWDSDDSELAAQLLNGRTETLSTEYNVSVINAEDNKNFELSPKTNDSIYELVTISFVNDALDIIHLDGRSGEQTVWQFNNLIINSPIANSSFEFEIPDGIEVVNNINN
ncbi:MAG: outer membrane lipoprotein chaperone LolA [Gammaproteobacteria bacterium]|nr:outer membrane lipoprotein chaperone LolA [Gammaproteobacteria bacterium]